MIEDCYLDLWSFSITVAYCEDEMPIIANSTQSITYSTHIYNSDEHYFLGTIVNYTCDHGYASSKPWWISQCQESYAEENHPVSNLSWSAVLETCVRKYANYKTIYIYIIIYIFI